MPQMNYLNVAGTYGQGMKDRSMLESAKIQQDAARQQMAIRDQSMQQNKMQFDQQQQMMNTRWLAGASAYAMENPAALPALINEGKRRGIINESLDPASVTPEQLQVINQEAMAMMGGPEFVDVPAEQAPAGQRNPVTGEYDPVYSGNSPRVTGPLQEYNQYVADEQAAGRQPMPYTEWKTQFTYDVSRGRSRGTHSVIPAGTVASAYAKYPRMKAARRDIDGIWEAHEKLKAKTLKGGPVYGSSLYMTEDGQSFQRYVDSLMAHYAALTRIPGVGAQSDWEGRLMQAPLPSLDQYPSVREQALRELEVLVDDLERAVAAVASGETSAITEDISGEATPTGRTAVNPETGERVQEMSDGEWIPIP